MLGRPARDVQGGGDDGERDDTDGKVDVEHPAPAQMLGEQAAQQRPEHAGRAEDRAEQPLVAAAFPGRYDVADDRHRQHHQPAAAEPLERAEADELGHVLGGAAQRGTGEEDDDRGLEQLLAAVLVAQFAPQGCGGGRGQQIGGDHPGQVLQAAEVADDGGQRGRHDGLVQRRQQQPEQQGADRDEDVPRDVLTGGFAVGAGRARGAPGASGVPGASGSPGAPGVPGAPRTGGWRVVGHEDLPRCRRRLGASVSPSNPSNPS